MTAQLTDTHTHLDSEEFDHDRAEVIQRARAAGVERIVTIGAGRGFTSADNAIALAQEHSFIWASAGIHPHCAATEFDPDRLEKLARHPRVVAIGETGLDFFRDWSPRDMQEKWFRAQIEIALALSKPIIIHSRSAGEECFAILKEMGAARVGGVFHCYAEDEHFAARLREINFLVSIPGSITFKKAEEYRRIVQALPIEQIMVETDAPYMAPEPHRGKRCETAFVVDTARRIAEIRGVSLEMLAEQTGKNADRLFGFNRHA